MNTQEIFQIFDLIRHSLVGQLDAQERESLINQFNRLFSSPEAAKAKGVVYVWSTKKPIPRLKDKSDIIYIGKTVQSLSQRYGNKGKEELQDFSWPRYKHIILDYGPIEVSYAFHENPTEMEKKFVDSYYNRHLEIPPFNRNQ